jgi:hypothetical protein
MITITCGDCGFKNKPQKYVLRKLTILTRRSDLIYKCKKCNATLNILRDESQWKMRWIESPNMELSDPIRAEDL